jgi:hypothetical protein
MTYEKDRHRGYVGSCDGCREEVKPDVVQNIDKNYTKFKGWCKNCAKKGGKMTEEKSYFWGTMTAQERENLHKRFLQLPPSERKMAGGKKKHQIRHLRHSKKGRLFMAGKRVYETEAEMRKADLIGAIQRVNVGHKTFYADHDEIGNLRVWNARDWNSKREESTWYFDDEELRNMPTAAAVRLLESGGAI